MFANFNFYAFPSIFCYKVTIIGLARLADVIANLADIAIRIIIPVEGLQMKVNGK